MSEIYYIAHHGVKGMKWGVRRYQRKDGSRTSLGERHQLKLNRSYDDPDTAKRKAATATAKSAYKTAKKEYNQSFNAYYNKTHQAYSLSKKKRQANDERFKDALNKADNLKKAKTAYKDAKKNELTDEQRAEKRKKAVKVGAAVVGTALAAYGTYKVAQYVQDKRSQAAMQKAEQYIRDNVYKKMGTTKWADGTVRFDWEDSAGNRVYAQGSRSAAGKIIGEHNARTIATGRQMYKDATSTKFDKGLAKIVNTGDAVGNTAKRAATSVGNTAKRAATSVGNTAKRAATPIGNTATKAKNRVLDVVNPIYEYVPGSATSNTKMVNGLNVTETVTNYYKKKKRR